MQAEVRDDIDAKISEGEFILSADVVRYIGLSTLMKMRDRAKEGLKKMEQIGQMGNAEEVPNAEALHGGDSEMDDEMFGAEVDSIMNENTGGEEPAFAEGGYVDPENEPLYKSSPIKGFEMVAMTNESGNTIYIPHVNGKPLLEIPAGYVAKKKGILPSAEEDAASAASAAAAAASASASGSGGSDPNTMPPTQGPVPSFDKDGKAIAATTGLSNKVAGLAGTVVGLLTGIPMVGLAAGQLNKMANESYAKDAANVNRGTSDTMGENFAGGVTATTGATGTGGQAANAAASAAAAATAAGYSEAAIGAAAQAAATATINGASPTAAAQAGLDAASKTDNQTVSEITSTISSRGGSTGGTGPQSQTTVDEYGQIVDNSPLTVGGPISNQPDSGTPLGPAPDSGTTTNDGGSWGDTSMGGTSSFDSAYSAAKGGFVTKKNKPVVKTKRGLASRK
jgi:hypothetical protein